MTIPRGELDIAQVEAILRPFRFASLVAGSQMSKAEATRIAEDSKANWWEKNARRFASETVFFAPRFLFVELFEYRGCLSNPHRRKGGGPASSGPMTRN